MFAVWNNNKWLCFSGIFEGLNRFYWCCWPLFCLNPVDSQKYLSKSQVSSSWTWYVYDTLFHLKQKLVLNLCASWKLEVMFSFLDQPLVFLVLFCFSNLHLLVSLLLWQAGRLLILYCIGWLLFGWVLED